MEAWGFLGGRLPLVGSRIVGFTTGRLSFPPTWREVCFLLFSFASAAVGIAAKSRTQSPREEDKVLVKAIHDTRLDAFTDQLVFNQKGPSEHTPRIRQAEVELQVRRVEDEARKARKKGADARWIQA